MKKRLLALLLVLALLATFVPFGVTAEGVEDAGQESVPVPQEEGETPSEEQNTEETPEQTTENTPVSHSHSAEGHDCLHCDGAAEWIPLKNGDALPTTTGHYYLTEDLQVSVRHRIIGSEQVVICLNGYTINCAGSEQSVLRVDDTAALVLDDCTAQLDENGRFVSGGRIAGGVNAKGPGGAVYATEQSRVTLRNIEFYQNSDVSGGAKYYGGGAIHARHDVVLHVISCLFTENTSCDGGAIGTRGFTQVTVENTVFRNNSATKEFGGAISFTKQTSTSETKASTIQKAATLTVSGCLFEGNAATTRGGAVMVENAISEITDSTFTGNSAAKSGGALYFSKGNNTVTRCLITDNRISDSGGSGVYVAGGSSKVTLDSCTVTGNKVYSAKTDYQGGVYVTNKSDKLTITGKTVIDGNLVGVDENGVAKQEINLVLQNEGATIKVDGLAAGSKLSLYTQAGALETPSFLEAVNAPETWDKTWITYDNNGMAVDYDKEKTEFFFTATSTHIHCACGDHWYTDENCQHGTNAGCDHELITYMPWESTTSLPKDPGNYYLTGDVVVSKETPLSTNSGIPDLVNLCLNGYTITVDYETEGKINDQIFYITREAELTLSDCTAHVDENGQYVAGKLTGGSYGVISVSVTGKYSPAAAIRIHDGILAGNTAKNNGGAINMTEGASTLNMYGGLITGNAAGGNGGAVYVGKGNSFHMHGGQITGNTAGTGAVYIHPEAAAVSIQGDAVITGNTAGTSESNLYLGGQVLATIGQLGEKASIGISGDLSTLPRPVSANQTTLDGLVSDSQYRPLELIEGIVHISFAKDHAHCDCGGGDIGCDHQADYWVAWDNSAALPAGSGRYYLVTDVSLSTSTALSSGELHLCLNGHTVTADGEEGTKYDRIYTVSGDAKLTISDCTAVYAKDGSYTAGKLTGGSYGAIFIPNYDTTNADGTERVNICVITLYDGMITGNTNAGYGGAVSVQDGAIFRMYGGQISKNAAKVDTSAEGKTSGGHGGAVYVGTAGSFELHGGAVCGNTAEDTATVYVDKATFTMTGGRLANNQAKTGAGVLVTGKAGLFTLEGGELSGNTATGAAGGILLQGGAGMNMTGGTVSGNTGSHGGGIYISYGTTLTMTGGRVSGNKAAKNGGGLYVLGGTAKLSGGKVSENTAGADGGGIYCTRFVREATETREEQIYTSVLELSGAVVSGNSTGGNGGGVVANQGTQVSMTAGAVSSNRAADAAGGILTQSRSVLSLRGGSISYNVAKNGAGAYISTGTTLYMSGGSVSNNTASVSGAGLYLLRCNATLSGGSVAENSADVNGGGMYLAGGNIKLSGTNVRDNVAVKNGGGIGTTQAKAGDARYYTTLTMTGGTVSGNSAQNGGGVLTQSKTVFTLKDGVIENNKTTKSGAGCYISSTCTFNMEGGVIRGNEAEVNGAGVYHYKSDGTYTGGEIRGNVAKGNAGGLLATGLGNTITIKDLTITENSAKNGGGMVFQGKVAGMIEGGLFTNNVTEIHGGAMYVSSNTPVTITGGQFTGNTAGNRGGGIYLSVTSQVEASGATFTDNKAQNGGGIYSQSNLTIRECVVANNTAAENGGGIGTGKMGARMFMNPQGLVMENMTVENNTAGGLGGGMYLSVGHKAALQGVIVTDNTAGGEGGGFWAIYDLTMQDLTVTGNVSGGEGQAVYLAACQYDGESYVKGVMKLGGTVVVKDNQGGDLYIGEQTTVSVAKEGLAEGTHINVKLHSGLLTQTLYGAYGYEGGNLNYVVTAGDKSLTNPEYDPAWNERFNPTEEPTEEPTEAPTADAGGEEPGGVRPVAWVACGAAVVVIAAVAVTIAALSKKKKAASGK